MAILLAPSAAFAGQISGDEIKSQCEAYKPGVESWKTGGGLYVQGYLPWDTDCECRQKCQQLYSDCQIKCTTSSGLPPNGWGGCRAACLYAGNRCIQKCKPCNPNTQ